MRVRLLKTCGILSIALGVLHLAAAPLLLHFYRSMVSARAWELLSNPIASSHILVGVLLLPGYTMWLTAGAFPALRARRIFAANSLTVAAPPLLLIVPMRYRQYLTAPPFVAAVALTFLIAATALFATFGHTAQQRPNTKPKPHTEDQLLEIVKKMVIRMRRRNTLAALTIVLLAAVLGCKPRPATESPASSPAAATPAGPTANQPSLPMISLGSLSGTVHFTGRVPPPIKIDMSMDPACDMSGGGDNMSEQFAVRNGKLANAFVYVKSGPPAAFTIGSVGPAVVLDQKSCRYVPHVIGLVKGQSVEFRNSDITMHNIHTMPSAIGSQSIDISQSPKGASQVKQFNQVETMIPVRCNNHPWMNAFINVSQTPFFGITDADGNFSLNGLPAGDYTLGAVHEKLGEQTIQVTVKPLSTTDASFTFAIK